MAAEGSLASSWQPAYCLHPFRITLFLCKLTCRLFPLPCQDVLTGSCSPALKLWRMNEHSGVELLTLRGICRWCVISQGASPCVFSEANKALRMKFFWHPQYLVTSSGHALPILDKPGPHRCCEEYCWAAYVCEGNGRKRKKKVV